MWKVTKFQNLRLFPRNNHPMSGSFLRATHDYGMVYRSYTTSEPLKSEKLPARLKSSRMGQFYSLLYHNTTLIARSFIPVGFFLSLTNCGCGFAKKKEKEKKRAASCMGFLIKVPEKQSILFAWPFTFKLHIARKQSKLHYTSIYSNIPSLDQL